MPFKAEIDMRFAGIKVLAKIVDTEKHPSHEDWFIDEANTQSYSSFKPDSDGARVINIDFESSQF